MKLWRLVLVVPLILARTGVAQQNVTVPPGPSTEPSPVSATTQTKTPEADQNKPAGRLFGVLPNRFTVENAGQLPPLTAAEKFKTNARDAFDLAEFAWYGALAGIGQLNNSEHTYGQGAEGYGKRYGLAFADGTMENFASNAIFPSILHQDPRYYQLGKGSVGHRAWYSLRRVFITRGDNGSQQFNYSEIFGSASAAAISTYAYHPAEDKHVGTVMTVWGEQIGYDALSFLAKEFWPDVQHKFLHKSKSPARQATN